MVLYHDAIHTDAYFRALHAAARDAAPLDAHARTDNVDDDDLSDARVAHGAMRCHGARWRGGAPMDDADDDVRPPETRAKRRRRSRGW